MVCKKCGKYNDDHSVFCSDCGAVLKSNQTNYNQQNAASSQNNYPQQGYSQQGYSRPNYQQQNYSQQNTRTAQSNYTPDKSSSDNSNTKIIIIAVTVVLVLALLCAVIVVVKKANDDNPLKTPIVAEETEGVNSLRLSEHEKTLGTGDKEILTAICEPDDAEVIWSSSDTTVVKVDEDGVITGITAGSAVITASAGKLSDTCVIKVKAPKVTEVVVETTKVYVTTPVPPIVDSDDYWLDSISIKRELGGESYLAGKDYDEVQKMINEILARHGYKFKKHNANTVCWENQYWYEPLYDDMNYVESTFNRTEKENYEFLAYYRNKYLK